MDNSLAALLKLTQQQSGASSPFECLVASLQEKENKLAQLTKDLKELQEEFQTNYDIIIRRDSKIEEMKGMYEAKDSEYKVISARAKQSQDEINLANERSFGHNHWKQDGILPYVSLDRNKDCAIPNHWSKLLFSEKAA